MMEKRSSAMTMYVCCMLLFLQLPTFLLGEDCSLFGYYNIPQFGANCQYRCRCVNEEQCDRDTGRCQNGCALGWMGPGCQYRNIALLSTGAAQKLNSDSNASVAIDSDMTTCSNSITDVGQGTWWGIDLPNPHYIVGLVMKIETATRIPFRVEGSNDGFGTDTPVLCYQHTEVEVPTQLEIMCLEPMNVQHIRIVAPATSETLHLCETEIYGGRYISYKGQTAQSSIFWGTSAAAVDGRPMLNGDSQEADARRTCAVTRKELGASWRLQFTQDVLIQGVHVYGRRLPLNPEYNEQIMGFVVHVVPRNGSYTQIYSDNPLSYSWEEYQPRMANLASPRKGRGIFIQHNLDTLFGHLSLCEVEVFAECELGQCGWNCSDVCHCATVTTGSHRKDGICPYGCMNLWTGQNGRCDITCPDNTWGPNCASNCYCSPGSQCHIDNGTCPGECALGWKGPACNTSCDNNMYGQNCNKSCGHCRDKTQCNTFAGLCPGECDHGWQGSLCQKECDDHYHGQNCSTSCGHCFASEPCNKVTGNCHSCNAGYKGNDCKIECDNTEYGFNCNETCGKCKHTETCSATTGRCPGKCEPGWQGVLCKEPCDDSYYGPGCALSCGQCLHSAPCNKTDGNCDSCDKGYKGTLCMDKCINGTYGHDCTEICGRCKNNETCDIFNGTCPKDCEPGKQGPTCKEECDDGFYGDNCNSSCGNCHPTCHKLTGQCIGCAAGYKGELCIEACDVNRYGFNCNETCGNCTHGSDCNRFDGKCTEGCAPGYIEPLCKHATSAVQKAVMVPLLVMLGSSLVWSWLWL